MFSLRSIWLVAATAILFVAFYALDHGIFIGASSYVVGDGFLINKRCRYFFVTGPVEIDAPEGTILLWPVLQKHKAELAAAGFSDHEIADWQTQELANGGSKALKDFGIPDGGYCRLFAK